MVAMEGEGQIRRPSEAPSGPEAEKGWDWLFALWKKRVRESALKATPLKDCPLWCASLCANYTHQA